MKEKERKILINETNTSPYKEIRCPCGCESLFIPKRRDQVYKNSKHANFAYNHGKRKQVSKNQRIAESQLRKNDKIVEKYYLFYQKKLAVVFSLNLAADGFDHSFFIGNHFEEGLLYKKTYNYLFHEYEKDGRRLTQIIKQKTKVYVKR